MRPRVRAAEGHLASASLVVVAALAAGVVAAELECNIARQHDAVVAVWTETGGPDYLEGWTWPVALGGDHCEWSGIVCEDGCIVELQQWGGMVGTLPDVWHDLSTIRVLSLGSLTAPNRLSGSLPPSLAALQDLTALALGFNHLTGSAAVLEALPALERINIDSNRFSSALPVLAAPDIELFSAEGCFFSGPIPPEYGSLSKIVQLDLSNNRLTSPLPPELGLLPRTTMIDLSHNADLDGVLPHTLLGFNNLLVSGTSVDIGCDAGWRYNETTYSCFPCSSGHSVRARMYLTACTPCGPGLEAAHAEASGCSPCVPGTFSNGTANEACSACPDMLHSGAGATQCGLCPPGSVPDPLSAACLLCPAGSTSLGGFGGCEPCPAGTVSAAGDAECSLCGPGTASALPGSVACDQCPAGTFANGAGSTECVPCPAGLAALSAGAANCEPCGAGRVPFGGATACVGCSVGTSTDGADAATSCAPCPAGSIAPEPSAALCEPCPVGWTSDDARAVCAPCPAGSSTDGAEGAECVPCPAGSASGAGAAVCGACEPGTFAAVPGRHACSRCPDGWSTGGAAGATACTPCPAGSFASATNATCSLCAPGSFAPAEGLAACTLCPVGTHQPEAGAAASCPACRYPGRCRGGNECASGYSGAGCLFCAVGHFRLSNVCLTCPVVPWPLFVLVALAAAFLYAASRNRLGARQTTVIKILFFFVQMVVVSLAVEVEWPAAQESFVEAFSFASAEIGLPMAECYVSVGWYTGFVGSLAGPVAVILVFWTATMVTEWRRRRAWVASEDASQDFGLMAKASHLRRLWIAACTTMHLPLVRVLLSAFDCERNADGDLVVAGSDDGTRCDSATHAAVQAANAVALVLVGLVAPVLATRFVLRLRRTDRLDKGEVQAAWGALYEAYRPEYCYTEGVVAMRKVLVTLTLVVPGIAPGWRSLMLLGQTLVWAVFVFVRRPYTQVRGRLVVQRTDVINELEVVVSAVLALHQGVAGLAAVASDDTVPLGAGIALVVATVLVLAAGLWLLVRVGRGFEVNPTRFNRAQALKEQQAIYRAYLCAIDKDDFAEAARLRADGVRHARQSREFAEWRTNKATVSTSEVPFLEMVVAEEETSAPTLEEAILAARDGSALRVAKAQAATAGLFDLVALAHARLDAIGGPSRPPPRRLPPLQ